jgi:exopolysaccharide biosynthesis polyprenyl glycosylphosphotransferase
VHARLNDKSNLLVASDSIAMALSLLIAFLFGHKGEFTYHHAFHYQFGIITLITVTYALLVIFDVYSIKRTSNYFIRQALNIGLAISLSAVCTTFIFFFFRDTVPRAVFIIFYLSTFVLMVLFRYLLIRNTDDDHINVLVVGGGERCAEVISLISERDYLHTRIIGCLSDVVDAPESHECSRLGDVSDLLFVVDDHNVDHIIVALEPLNDYVTSNLVDCMSHGIQITNFTNIVEHLTNKIPIDHLSDKWFLLELGQLNKRYFWRFKRAIDICIAFMGMALALPLFLLAAAAIKLESRGPVFYVQSRIGRGNRPFDVWKLRTMIDGADKNNVHWTEDNDNRITRVGKVLRKMRFDEVPQLLNMLKGEMSLIGPRPEAVSLVEKYMSEIPFYLERHMIAPGITGWAQINYRYGNSIEDTRQKLMYDFYYIKNRCAMLDTIIFLRTIRTVLTGKGAM